jgi:polyhydroxyalkanoate synthase
MPRPLPAHLASAMLFWASSRAGLMGLSSGLPPSNHRERLRGLADEVRKVGPEAVGAALDRELARRADRFIAGLEAYRRHPYRRAAIPERVLWQEGTTRLLDYSSGVGAAVLVVPSLINRYYILDLVPERSFLRHLAAAGLRPFVVDWGEPSASESGFGLDDYICDRLDRAVGACVAAAGTPIAVAGYCMGGLLALALALRRPRDIAALALLATPWDFHAEKAEQARLLGAVMDAAPRWCGPDDTVPLALIQGLFLSLDPFLAERKFVRFADLDQAGDAARNFVALEDWINDGVTLARGVARNCAAGWYRDNKPMRGEWQVAGQAVAPSNLGCPALVVVPSRDRIVPPRSAEALAAALPQAETLRPPFGHIGMMSAAAAPKTVWIPIAGWLRKALDSK